VSGPDVTFFSSWQRVAVSGGSRYRARSRHVPLSALAAAAEFQGRGPDAGGIYDS
jgi:hypothetical protein